MKTIQSIILLSLALHKCYCIHNDKLGEILKYCHKNGHKYVSILDENGSQFKPYSMLLNSNDIRGRFVNRENMDALIENMDFLIVEKDKILQFSEILTIMNGRNIQKSLLVINEDEVQEFKVSN